MNSPLPYPGQFSGAELDEVILTVRTSLLQGIIPLANGNINGPSLRFALENNGGLNNSGLYRAGNGDFRFAIAAQDVFQMTAVALTLGKPMRALDGTVGAPSYSFVNGTGSGMYRAGASDIRLGVSGVDFLVMNYVTAAGATNVPSLGIGTPPLRGGLHIRCPNNVSTGTGIQLENTDPTDGNATGFSARCTTTGAGGAVMSELGKFNFRFDIHDFATRTSHLDFNWTDNGTGMFIQFIGIGGVRGLRSDTGALTISATSGTLLLQTGGLNADVKLSPNGSGNIVLDLAKPLRVVSGTNQRSGDAVLVAGTVTVTNATVTANTRVFLTRKTTGGTLGDLHYSVTAGSFTITSFNVADTSTVSYFLVEVS